MLSLSWPFNLRKFRVRLRNIFVAKRLCITPWSVIQCREIDKWSMDTKIIMWDVLYLKDRRWTLVFTLKSTTLFHRPTSSTEQSRTTAVQTVGIRTISRPLSKIWYRGWTFCSKIRHSDFQNVGSSRAILLSCPPYANTPDIVYISRDHVCTGHKMTRKSRTGRIVGDGLLSRHMPMSRTICDIGLKPIVI